MAKNTYKPEPSGINLGDIVYVLFKHKWKILLTTLVALGAAGAYYFLGSPVYESQAKLLVKYVLERNSVDQVDNKTATATASTAVNDAIMGSQMEILTSWDLAAKVAQKISEDRHGGNSPAISAGSISQGLTVNSTKGSNVIVVSFKHNDPDTAKTVLDELLKLYFAKHLEIYRSREAAESLAQKRTKSRNELIAVNTTLADLKKESWFLSLTDAMAKLNIEMGLAEAKLGEANATVAEQRARVAAIERLLPGAAESGGNPAEKHTVKPAVVPGAIPDDASSPVPAGDAAGATVAAAAPKAGPDRAVIVEYQALMAKLTQFRSLNAANLAKFPPGSAMARASESQIATLEKEQREMESRYPDLVATVQAAGSAPGPRVDLLSERTELAAAEARAAAAQEAMDELRKRADDLKQAAPQIAEAERRKEIEEGSYKFMTTSLEKAEVDLLVNSDNIPNITSLQAPTPAAMDVKQRNKIALGIAGGGPALAIGLVLLFGLILNRSIKRPMDLEERLGIPLLLSIPYFNGRGRQALRAPGEAGQQQLANGEASRAPWDPGHYVRPYSEAIRDRMGHYFDLNRLTHKPKLIAVTGFGVGAGTSTLAAGLAASFSEVGDGKVLLVDMNEAQGEVHPFFEGRPAISLTNALKANGTLQSTAENLYLATTDSPAPGAGSLLVKNLSRILPQLKGSDFDYVIFDMPPLSPTSPTATIAALMDQVLVVVEAEANTPDVVKRGYRDLTDSGASVSMVFNKARRYGPQSLVGSF